MSINERKDKSGKIQEVDLGLAENEQQALDECRHTVADDAELNDMRDATLARYLRANKWQVEPAVKQLKEYLKWRKDNNIDSITDNPMFPSREMIRTIIPYAYHNTDKEGRPLYIEKTGMIATAALADSKIVNPQHLLRSHIYGVEMLQKAMHEESLKRGTRVNGITTILDMNGLGFHHRGCMMTLKECMDFDQKYYPEYLGKLYVINTPWVTPYLYQAVQVFLDEVTKSRIQIVSGNPSEFLLQHIAPENLPIEYGGTCDGTACRHGGHEGISPVKGCLDVLDSSTIKAAEIEGLDSQTVAYDFEKVLSASATGTGETFTWYFEVADGYDIDFSVELLPVSGVQESDPNKRVYVQKVERLKVGQGTFKAPYPNAKVILRWDNNFSYFTSKNIKYTCSVVTDSSHLDTIVQASSSSSASSSSGSAAKPGQ